MSEFTTAKVVCITTLINHVLYIFLRSSFIYSFVFLIIYGYITNSHTDQLSDDFHLGSRVGAVVRALASHQCGPGSNPGPGVICGLSLLLVLALLRGFFSGFSGFPPSTKTNISKFQSDREFEGHRFVSLETVMCYPR